MASEEKGLEELAQELISNDEYPLPEKRDKYPLPEKKQITYKDVDITITFNKDSKTGEGDEEHIMFTDSDSEFTEMVYDDKNEILRVPIVLAKEMVYHYDGYDAFRPKEELEEVAKFLRGVPVTRGHPEAKMVTDREEVLGWATGAEFEDDELRAILEITDKELINDIRSKKLQGVSPGHFSKLDRTSSGEYNGEHYDLTQRDIFVDHIAIVERGKCNTEDGCGILGMMSTKLNEIKTKEGDEVKIMKGILSKLDTAIDLAAKLDDETLKSKLEEIKKAIEEEDKKMANDDKAKEEDSDPKIEIDEAAIKKVEEERDTLRVELDAIVEEEKTKLVDELESLQDVKTKEVLAEMSLDSLKSDLELVRALRDRKFSTDGHGDSGDGQETIKSAYKNIGMKGGNR